MPLTGKTSMHPEGIPCLCSRSLILTARSMGTSSYYGSGKYLSFPRSRFLLPLGRCTMVHMSVEFASRQRGLVMKPLVSLTLSPIHLVFSHHISSICTRTRNSARQNLPGAQQAPKRKLSCRNPSYQVPSPNYLQSDQQDKNVVPVTSLQKTS